MFELVLVPLGVLMVCESLDRFQLSWSTAIRVAVLVVMLVVVVLVMVRVAVAPFVSAGMVHIPSL